MSRLGRSLALLWGDLCTTQAYLVITAIVATSLRLSFDIAHIFRSEPCTGILHKLWYLLEASI